jgi:hypothetical protein
VSANHQGSVSPVERYNFSRCHLGTSYHSAAISTSQALRKRLFLRGGHVRDLTHPVGRTIYLDVIKVNVNKALQ